MIGIYIYINKINNKKYVGQSIDILRRKYMHEYNAFNKNTLEYNSKFHKALRKYGLDNFIFDILEECEKEKLSEREQYWIEFYDSFKNGYNATPGGEYGVSQPHEKNGRALLKLEDVVYIRNQYNNRVPFRFVYEEYKNKISKRGLQKIWYFETWKDVLSEYNTIENKNFHNTKAKKMLYYEVHNSCFSKNDIKKMREAKEKGVSRHDYYNKNFINKCHFSTFEKMWYRKDI